MELKENLNENTNIYLVPYSHNNRKAYHKKFNKIFNPNEFIGEELCKNMNIASAHYFLVGYGYFKLSRVERYGKVKKDVCSFGVGSIDFRQRGKEYFKLNNDYEINVSLIDKLLKMCPSEENRKELLDELSSMFALDIYMGQEDRYAHNVIYTREKNGDIHLAPVYDFEKSFLRSTKGHVDYGTDLIDFYDNDVVRDYMSEHPKLKDNLERYLDIDLVDISLKSYNDRGIKLDEEYADYLDFMDKDRKKLIKKLIK